MTVKWSHPQTTIGHLAVRYRGPITDLSIPILRLRTERLLDNIDLQPQGLPSSAILIVRKLSSPTPVSATALTQTAQPVWTQQLHEQIAILASTAARPALGQVAASATSVLFADPAEMLAALTRDLLAKRTGQQWYWQQLLRNVPSAPGIALATVWSEQASFVPAALGYMRREEAYAAVALLSPTEVIKVITALHERFDLPALMLTPSLSGMPPTGEQSGGFSRMAPTRELSDAPRLLPPWHSWLLPVSLPVLTPQAQYLLGLAATLFSAPAFARSTKFAVAAASWLRTESALSRVPSSSTQQKGSVLPQPAHGLQSTSMQQESSQVIQEQSASDQQSMFPIQERSTLDLRSASTQEQSTSMQQESTQVIQEQSASDQKRSVLADEVIIGVSQPLPTDGVSTELGGILYLINLLIWLNLPGSWDEDGSFAEHLSGWAIVEALAKGLLGSLYDRYSTDPIWHLLVLLDRREPSKPVGAHLPQQNSFRLPEEWLRWYGSSESPLIATIAGERLLVHAESAGYLVADLPLLGHSPDEVLRAEQIEASRIVHPFSVSDTAKTENPIVSCIALHLSQNMHWWLERMLCFVRYLLSQILGIPAADPDQLAELLLCQHGQLLVSRTHIDLYMPIDEIRLPIRRAGLDRDPGWVPDLSRIVLFHFD